jgi:hypothetical protein
MKCPRGPREEPLGTYVEKSSQILLPIRLVFTRIQARDKKIMFVFSKTGLEKLGNATQGPIEVSCNKS